VYGFGQNLAWQYKMVTIIGLIMLAINYYQCWGYQHWPKIVNKQAIIIVGITIVGYLGYQSIPISNTKFYYNMFGSLSCLCWLSFVWPQVYKNHINKHSNGISKGTTNLSLISGIGDLITAYSLSWPLTSKISFIAILIPKALLVVQIYQMNKPLESH
jgi:hypothetical protein